VGSLYLVLGPLAMGLSFLAAKVRGSLGVEVFYYSVSAVYNKR